jgi:hypothetical protein
MPELIETNIEPSEVPLHALRVTRIEVGPHGFLQVELEAKGPQENLDVVTSFTNAGWLNDLSLHFLNDLLDMQSEDGSVSLREEGWAVLENNGKWVRISDSFSDERCAIVLWDEFKKVIELKREFLCLLRYCKKFGVPRYSVKDGFRIRLGHSRS